MLEVGRTSDGKPIVSSWGYKYILEHSTNQDDLENARYREYK